MGRQRGDAGAKPGGKGLPPSQRPTKVCPVCGRPFSWRKKWSSVWDQVIYCSDRCRRQRGGPSVLAGLTDGHIPSETVM